MTPTGSGRAHSLRSFARRHSPHRTCLRTRSSHDASDCTTALFTARCTPRLTARFHRHVNRSLDDRFCVPRGCLTPSQTTLRGSVRPRGHILLHRHSLFRTHTNPRLYESFGLPSVPSASHAFGIGGAFSTTRSLAHHPTQPLCRVRRHGRAGSSLMRSGLHTIKPARPYRCVSITIVQSTGAGHCRGVLWCVPALNACFTALA